MVVSKVKDNV